MESRQGITYPLSEAGWVPADAVPLLFDVRQEARIEANNLMEARMQHLREGHYELVPHLVDPLTTAGRVLAAEAAHGQKSVERAVAYESLGVDCRRVFAEAYRKRSWEYFPPLQQPYNPTAEAYMFKGRRLDDMVAAGVTPAAHPEEGQHRVSEFVEESTYKAVRKLGCLALFGAITPAQPEQSTEPRAPEVSVITVSECADWAIEAYEVGQASGHPMRDLGGYAPENKKLMVRGVLFGTADDSRYQEQLGMSGVYITHEVVVETMRRIRILDPNAHPSKLEVRATQIISYSRQGVINFARMLDSVASEMSGKRIFLGEVVDDAHPCNYEAIPQEAAEREAQLEASSKKLADYLIELEQDKTDHFAAGSLVEDFIQKELLKLVADSPDQAAITFDDATAEKVQTYMQARAAGNHHMAQAVWELIEATAPPASFCGAGSCGLEGVSVHGIEAVKAKKLGLEASKDGDLLHDTQRKCPNPKCNQLKVFYDKSGNKACTACGMNTTGVTSTPSILGISSKPKPSPKLQKA